MHTEKQGKISKNIFNAVIHENISQIKNLITAGISIDAPSIDADKQVLHIACEYNKNVDFIEKLIELKANVNAKTDRGFTPLHVAAQRGNGETVLALLKAGADVDAANSSVARIDDGKGTTSLQEAAHHGHLNVVKILVMAGSNTQYCEAQHQFTAMDFAQRKGRQDILLALMGYDKEFIAHVRKEVESWSAINQIETPAKEYISRIKNISYVNVSADDYFRGLQKGLNDGYEPLRESVIKKFRSNIIVHMKQYNADKRLSIKINADLLEKTSSLHQP